MKSDRESLKAEDLMEAISELNGLTDLTAEKSDFYYDETNNYRKVRLRNGKLSFEGDGDFVLGGIVTKNGNSLDVDELKQKIRLDKSAKEMKFKHVASGSLVAVLKSNKLKSVLRFLAKNEVSIHLQRINVLYWSIVDIIDSVIAVYMDSQLMHAHMHLKDRLYQVLIRDKAKALLLLNDFKYPDIEEARLADFYRGLLAMVRPQMKRGDVVGELLLYVLESGVSLREAAFIQNEERGLLIDGFSHFYRHRALMFPNSRHYFDVEQQVERELREVASTFRGKELSNYFFIDSQQSHYIQLADVVVGYFSKLYNFCKNRTAVELLVLRDTLNESQLEVLRLSRELIDKSDLRNKAYFHQVVPISDHGAWAAFVY